MGQVQLEFNSLRKRCQVQLN